MRETIEKVNKWHREKNLNTPASAMLKVCEEMGELVGAHLKHGSTEVAGEAGDLTFALIGYLDTQGLDIESCLKTAYAKVKDRKGVVRGGTFVKEEDL